jgi:hypothetical protein
MKAGVLLRPAGGAGSWRQMQGGRGDDAATAIAGELPSLTIAQRECLPSAEHRPGSAEWPTRRGHKFQARPTMFGPEMQSRSNGRDRAGRHPLDSICVDSLRFWADYPVQHRSSDGDPQLDHPAATSVAAVPFSERGEGAMVNFMQCGYSVRVSQHDQTSADAPRPAQMGLTPAVGLLARGLGMLAFPGLVGPSGFREHPSPLTVAGAASDLQAEPAYRIPCYPLAGTVGADAVANPLRRVEQRERDSFASRSRWHRVRASYCACSSRISRTCCSSSA